MKISSHRNVESGFTLVEIMAVLCVIGIMVGLVTFSIGGHSERLLNNEAQRLFQKIRLVTEEAEYSKNEYGLGLTKKNGYQFFRFDERLMEWVKIDKDFFKPIEMDDGFELSLDTSENKLDSSVLYTKPQKEEVTYYGEKKVKEPEIMFFSDGQITPFKLFISNKKLSKNIFIVSSDLQSELSLKIRE